MKINLTNIFCRRYRCKITKSLVFSFCLFAFCLSSSKGFSQDAYIKIESDNNYSLEKIFKLIKAQTSYLFVYDTNMIEGAPSVSLKKGQIKVAELLQKGLTPANCTFEFSNNTIVVKKKVARTTIAQNTKVRGSIADPNGLPLPGANILEKGTTNGAQSDFDGNFALDLTRSDATLVISFIGYKTQELQTNGLSKIDIVLAEDSDNLDEVVVVGYGTQRKKDLTGAVASVKTEDFTPGANYDAVQLLNGSAAGVRVSQVSSAPGATLQIQIRGAGSINSSNSALFVVDGLPGVDPSSLSPDDIESIEVLKDASSSAIYGTRAANGVVLITTKNGKAGKASIDYSTYIGRQSIAEKIDVLGASDYMQLVNMRLQDRNDNPQFSSEDISNAGAGTNWQDELFRNAIIQNHQVGISGGSEKGRYYVGLNYFDQEGIVKKSDNKKYNIKVNVQSHPLERLKINTSLNFTRNNGNYILSSNSANEAAGPINSAIHYDPTMPTGLDENGEYHRNPSIALENPEALINGITNKKLNNTLYGNVSADYELIDNITATVRLGGRVYNERTDYYRDRTTLTGATNDGIASVGTTEITYWLTEYLLRYGNTFGDKHDFSVMGGTTLEATTRRTIGGNTSGFISDVLGTNNLGTGNGAERDNLNSSKTKNQLHGILGRVTYGYDGRYLLTASLRIDGSSRFTDKNKYAYFPSASLGWNISNEQFLANTTWLDNLKLRLGYGEIGNQGINNLETRQTLVANSGDRFVSGGQILQGVSPTRLPNPNLVWERTKEINFGLDYSVLNNRLSGSIDYFNRKTSDQLFYKPLPSVVGFSTVRTNIGEVENKGIEINLRSINIESGDFSWQTHTTLSFLKNRVKKLPDFIDEIIGGEIGTFTNSFNITKVGLPIRALYGYEISGIFQEGDDIEKAPTPDVQGYAVGMPKFVDQDGDGDIDSDDRVVLGDGLPDFTFGINNTLKYKNLSLDFFIIGVQGIETLDNNVVESLYPTNIQRNSISKYYLERWTPENPSNQLPSGHNSSLYGGARAINSLTVADASFVRLKNITLGYDFIPKSGFISNLRVYIAGDNLLTFTNYEGFDPDASANGESGLVKTSYNSYPLAKTIRLGLNVQF